MKDLTTGLSIAPLTHFPEGLREAVVRGQKASTGTPLVFFAEMLKKLSAGGKRRGEKSRFVLLTADALIVYDEDGYIKRRAKISDIVAVYSTAERSDYYTSVSSHHARTKFEATTPAAAKGGGAAGTNGGVFCSLAIVIHNGYDIALDVVAVGSHTSQPAEVVGHFIRAINILQRRNPKLANRELVVGLVPSGHHLPRSTGDSAAPDAFEDLFILKKPARGGQPLLPPTLEMVSEEAEKQKSMDAKLQVDEAISDLLNELDKYKKENWAKRNTKYITLLRRYSSSRTELEKCGQQDAALTAQVDELTASNERRSARINNDLSIARKLFLESVERLSTMRDDHEVSLTQIREGCEAAEVRTSDVVDQQVEAQHSYIERMKDLDALMRDMENEKAEVEHELSLRVAMPSLDDLKKEIGGLRNAGEQVQESIESSEAADSMKGDLREMGKVVRDENRELEADVLALRDVCKEHAVTTQQLAFQVSTLDAKRRRLALDCQDRDENIKSLTAQLEEAEALAEQKQSLLDMQGLMQQTIKVESTVCEDLRREAMIHESITASVAKMTLTNEYQSIDDERSISLELQRLREQRIELISRSGTPATPHQLGGLGGSGLTPRTPLSGSRQQSARRQSGSTPTMTTPREVSFARDPAAASIGNNGSAANRRQMYRDPVLGTTRGRSTSNLAVSASPL